MPTERTHQTSRTLGNGNRHDQAAMTLADLGRTDDDLAKALHAVERGEVAQIHVEHPVDQAPTIGREGPSLGSGHKAEQPIGLELLDALEEDLLELKSLPQFDLHHHGGPTRLDALATLDPGVVVASRLQEGAGASFREPYQRRVEPLRAEEGQNAIALEKLAADAMNFEVDDRAALDLILEIDACRRRIVGHHRPPHPRLPELALLKVTAQRVTVALDTLRPEALAHARRHGAAQLVCRNGLEFATKLDRADGGSWTGFDLKNHAHQIGLRAGPNAGDDGGLQMALLLEPRLESEVRAQDLGFDQGRIATHLGHRSQSVVGQRAVAGESH
jgi:hypothetical protein